MPQLKNVYVKPAILTLDSTEILALVGPAQGYGAVGGQAETLESIMGSGGGRYGDVNRR